MKSVLLVIFFFFLFFPKTGLGQNPRNILIDDLTSTNCGHCPCMDTVLQKVVLLRHPNTVIIAMHGPMSNYEHRDFFKVIDSLHFESNASIINRMGIPTEIDDIPDTVDARYARLAESPVKMELVSIVYDPVGRLLTVVVNSTALQADMTGQYRINAAVIESNLVGYQQHFPECPGGDAYNHKFVLRALAFNPVGDNLISGNWAEQNTIRRTFIFTLDSEWVDSNCDVVIYVDKKMGTLGVSEIQQSIKQGITRPLSVESIQSPTAILKIFPNPVHGSANVHIRLSEGGLARVALADMNGKIVKVLTRQSLAPGMYNLEFDATGLPAGTYLLQMEVNQQVFSTKIQIH
jgi:hypothetical protein